MAKKHEEVEHVPKFTLHQRVRLTTVGASSRMGAPRAEGVVRMVEPQPHWYDIEWPTGGLERIHEGWLEAV